MEQGIVSEGMPEPHPAPAGGKKIFGVPRRTFLIIIGAGALAGLGWYVWKRRQAATQASTSGTTGDTSTDTSGQLSTIQTELESILQAQGAGAGASSGGGGGGYWYNGGGTTGGGTTGDGSSSGGSSSGGGTNGAGSPPQPAPPVTVTTPPPAQPAPAPAPAPAPPPAQPAPPAAAPAATGGHVVSVSNNRATIAWNGNGAAYWSLQIVGPGAINGKVSTVRVPEGVYGGLLAGHNYRVNITPYTASGTPGPVGYVDIKTTDVK